MFLDRLIFTNNFNGMFGFRRIAIFLIYKNPLLQQQKEYQLQRLNRRIRCNVHLTHLLP